MSVIMCSFSRHFYPKRRTGGDGTCCLLIHSLKLHQRGGGVIMGGSCQPWSRWRGDDSPMFGQESCRETCSGTLLRKGALERRSVIGLNPLTSVRVTHSEKRKPPLSEKALFLVLFKLDGGTHSPFSAPRSHEISFLHF